MLKNNEEYIHLAWKAIAATNKLYSTPLLRLTEDLKKPELGTGTFVVIGGKRGILTNAHVAEIFVDIKYINVPHPDTNLRRLPYGLILSLPKLAKDDIPFIETPDIDMAFIVLREEACNIVVHELNKQFFDLDQAASEHTDTILFEKYLFLIYGAIGTGEKGKYDSIHKKYIVEFCNAGSYIVVPQYIEYGTCNYKQPELNILIDNIICPISTKEKIPCSFGGMSGGGLWQIFFDNKDEVKKIALVGVATQYRLRNKPEQINCRGKLALYKVFYPFCCRELCK